jgi:hypothetical protein
MVAITSMKSNAHVKQPTTRRVTFAPSSGSKGPLSRDDVLHPLLQRLNVGSEG